MAPLRAARSSGLPTGAEEERGTSEAIAVAGPVELCWHEAGHAAGAKGGSVHDSHRKLVTLTRSDRHSAEDTPLRSSTRA
jgi:hypothetical protein